MQKILKKIRNVDLKEVFLYLAILTLFLSNEKGLLTIEIGFTVFPSYVFALAGIILLGFEMLKKRSIRLPMDKVAISFLLFFTVISASIIQTRFVKDILNIPMSRAVSVFNRYPFARSITQVIAIGFMMLVYYFVISVIQDEKKLKKAIMFSIISATLCSIYGLSAYILVKFGYIKIIDFLGSITGNMPPVYIFFERGPRIQSTFSEPLIFGTFILSVLPITFMSLFTKMFKNKWMLVCAVVFQIAAVILTFSRGVWLSLVIVFLIMIPMLIIKKKYLKTIFNKKSMMVYGMLLLITLVSFNKINSYYIKFKESGQVDKMKELTFNQFKALTNLDYFIEANRINCLGGPGYGLKRVSSLEWSTMMRVNDMVAGLNMAKAHPILGVGWGNYIYNYLSCDPRLMGWWWIHNMPQTDNRPGTPVSPNLFVTVLAETGIIGFLTFLLLISFLLISIFRAIPMGIPVVDNEGLIACGYLVSIIGILICYNFFSTFYFTFVWIMFGIAMAVVNISLIQQKLQKA